MSIEFRRLWNSIVAVKKIDRKRQARRLNSLYRFLRREMKGLRTSSGAYIKLRKDVYPDTITIYKTSDRWLNFGIGSWLKDVRVYEDRYSIGGTDQFTEEGVLLCLIELAH